ncbi:hypothetical protein [Tellurirhabdus bombi]|uniref:hypothetical protein n=1 Tax=Tellurirhabdus bombi TaxID=2907205 RepID=UPI001F3FCA39|nr:hypothetical protein [Tellurirhabdus bombi]
MVVDSLTKINQRIAKALSGKRIEANGLATLIHLQSENGVRPVIAAEKNRPFVLDTKNFDVQLLHIFTGGGAPIKQPYGAFTKHVYNLSFTLVCVSKSHLLPACLNGLDSTRSIQVDRFSVDTNAIIGGVLRVPINQDKSYPPELFACSVNYTLAGVSQQDIELLYSVIELEA